MQTQGDRPKHTNSGYSKELNVQNVSYLMEFPSCSEKRSCLIFFRKLVHIKIFQIRSIIIIVPVFVDFFRFFTTIPLLILCRIDCRRKFSKFFDLKHFIIDFLFFIIAIASR